MAKIYYGSKEFAFVRGGPKRLKVSWSRYFKEAKIELDGKEIALIKDAHIPPEGHTIILPDGSPMVIKRGYHPIKLSPLPDITISGKQIPESAGDTGMKIIHASNYFLIGGILSIVFEALFFVITPNSLPIGIVLFVLSLNVFAIIVGIQIKKRNRKALTWGGLVIVGSLFIGVMNISQATGIDLVDLFLEFIDTALFGIGLKEGYAAMDYIDKEIKQVGSPSNVTK